MSLPQPNLDAVIHNVIKKYMSKRQQGLCMAELREVLGMERSFEHHLTACSDTPGMEGCQAGQMKKGSR